MFFRFLAIVAVLLSNLAVTEPAHAACTASGAGSFSAGSQIVGNQVLICANSSSSTSTAKSTTSVTSKSVTTKSIAAPKPVCPTSVSTTAQIVAAALLGCKIPGPSQPPVAIVVTKPKVATSLVMQPTSLSDQAAFSPNAVAISASKNSLTVGESSILTTDAATHERSATILGRIGYVRFVPVGFSWHSDSTFTATGAVAIASFDSVGTHAVSLKVDYAATYRFSLTEAWTAAGTVTSLASTTLQVSQTNQTMPTARLVGHLVWANCMVHASSYRC